MTDLPTTPDVLLMWILRNHDLTQTQENQCLFCLKNL